MKTTRKIADSNFRRAKAKGSDEQTPLRQFVGDVVAEELGVESSSRRKARVKLAGKLRHWHTETLRINRVIEREFETVDSEEGA